MMFDAVPTFRDGARAGRHRGDQTVFLNRWPLLMFDQIDAAESEFGSGFRKLFERNVLSFIAP